MEERPSLAGLSRISCRSRWRDSVPFFSSFSTILLAWLLPLSVLLIFSAVYIWTLHFILQYHAVNTVTHISLTGYLRLLHSTPSSPRSNRESFRFLVQTEQLHFISNTESISSLRIPNPLTRFYKYDNIIPIIISSSRAGKIQIIKDILLMPRRGRTVVQAGYKWQVASPVRADTAHIPSQFHAESSRWFGHGFQAESIDPCTGCTTVQYTIPLPKKNSVCWVSCGYLTNSEW